jgi:transcriptional regulator
MPSKSNKPLVRVDKQYPKLTIAAIDSLKQQGFTQSDIARMFGVTRQAVSWHKQY